MRRRAAPFVFVLAVLTLVGWQARCGPRSVVSARLDQACEPRPVTAPGEGFFTDVTVTAGLKSAEPVAGSRAHPRVAFADIDDDGWDDIVAHNMFPGVRAGTERFEHLIWRNNHDGTYSDWSEESGLRDVQAAFFAFGDVDGDGDTDVFAGLDILDHPEPGQTHSLWLNEGDGTFVRKEASGVEKSLGADQQGRQIYGAGNAVFADFDGDADLDLFLGNGNTGSTGYLTRNQLFLGNGDGTFTDASSRLGGNRATLANGSMACDFDDDADLDLFVSVYGVSNDGGRNMLFVNDGTGKFQNRATELGVDALPGGNYWRADLEHGRLAEPGKRAGQYIGGNGFGVDCPDIDNDGLLDILMADIAHSTELPPGYRGWPQEEIDAANYTRRWADPSQLLLNLGSDEGWAFANEWLDRGLPYNEGDIDSAAADFDNDGRLDIVVSRDKKYEASYSTYDQLGWLGLYHQQADGTFAAVAQESGINHEEDPTVSQRMRGSGVVNWSDIDHDGDLDLLVGGGPGSTSGHLFRNDIGQANDWLAVRVLGGDGVNRDGIGTRVTVQRESTVLTREVKASRGTYNSTDTRVLHFGLGDMPCDYRLAVRWPDGREYAYDAATVGRNHWLTVWPDGRLEVEGQAPVTPQPTELPTVVLPTAALPTAVLPTAAPDPTSTTGPERTDAYLPACGRGWRR